MIDYPQGLRGSSLTAGKMLKNIEIKMSSFKESISIVQSKSIVKVQPSYNIYVSLQRLINQ